MARIKKIDYNRENNRVSGKDVKQERCNMKLVYAIVHSDDADVVTKTGLASQNFLLQAAFCEKATRPL